MSKSEQQQQRAVIYVESGTSLRSSSALSPGGGGGGNSSLHPHSHHSANSSSSGSNYVIKIQIGEEPLFNPVRIDVSSTSSSPRGHPGGPREGRSGGGEILPLMALKQQQQQQHNMQNMQSMQNIGKDKVGNGCPCGGEDSSSPPSSGASSPRSDMITPPPGPRMKMKMKMNMNFGVGGVGSGVNKGGNRFGSETSESDTESDVSAEFLRPGHGNHGHGHATPLSSLSPLSCQAAQFALREICESGDSSSPSPPLPSMAPGGMQIHQIPPPLPQSQAPVMASLTSLSGVKDHHGGGPPSDILGAILTLSESMAAKRAQKAAVAAAAAAEAELATTTAAAAAAFMASTPTPTPSSELSTDIEELEDRVAELDDQILQNYDNPNNGPKLVILDEQVGFHVNEMVGFSLSSCSMTPNNRGATKDAAAEESLLNFAGVRDIFARRAGEGTKQILSDKGTIRGVKNRVRDGIATFLQSKDTKTYSEKEQGRVVVYTTSMGVVRSTFLRCQKVKQILRNLLVKFDERDCYMNRAIQNEIRHRLPNQMLALPQVFLEGQLLGDADGIEKLNETGELRQLLKPYKSLSVLSTCERCGGFRMLPCPICNGSKKSVHRNHFTTEFIALKCMHCDPSGLVRCDLCNSPDP